MDFSSLVWSVPMLLLFAMLLGFTLNHHKITIKANMGLAIFSFLLALCVIVERMFSSEQDYGYYLDWFVVDNFYYRIGYELNNTASYFLVIATAINVILHTINKVCKGNNSAYAYLNLIFGLMTGVIIADNVLTYYIISFCISVSLFLYFVSNNEKDQLLVIRKYVKTFITGHLLFLCALMLIFYHQPNHAVEFTVIDSSISMQPDLLSMDDEWIIGLLLIFSSLFTSTIVVSFERQFSKLSAKNMLLVNVLMSVRIILPAYLLIRFESLIRIDERIESIVLIVGIVVLICTAINVVKERAPTQKLLTISNAMLGMLYIMFGLQAKQMLSAFVLIFVIVQILFIVLLLFTNRQITYNIIKLAIGVILFLPFIICISTSNHYVLNETLLSTILNITTMLGMVTFSFIIISCLFSFKLNKARESLHELKYGYTVCTIIIVIALCMTATSSVLWWSEFLVNERSEFIVAVNRQTWINILLVCAQVNLGLLFVFIKHRLLLAKKIKSNKSASATGQVDESWILVKHAKTYLLKMVNLCELCWYTLWDTTIPYVFKKGERHVSLKQPRFVVKLILVWSIAIILSILLTIVRR